MEEIKDTFNSTTSSKTINFENLYPALFSCFVNILLGYVTGRINLISATEAKGIHKIVSNFALPSLIFLNLTKMDLSAVNWMFLLAILLSKAIVYIIVIIMYVILKNPSDLGSGSLLAIFATQSNDFAIGYPLAYALYQNVHPDYPSYLYLVAPINLAILNPISFALIEYSTQLAIPNTSILSMPMSRLFFDYRNSRWYGRVQRVANLIVNIITNPIIFMTLLGIACNLIFTHKMSIYITQILQVLGAAFPACALFLLGLRMVGSVDNLKGVGCVLPGLLILAKLIALPEVIRQITLLLHVGENEQDTTDWSTFGYFYGTIPSAPSVFIFATHYNLQVDLIATAMVACTFLSAPLMFVSAKMIALANIDPSQYINQLNAYSKDLSVAGLVTALWVLFVFILTKKITKIPHRFTACLLISQIFTCLGAFLWSFVDHQSIAGTIQFCLFTGGTFSTRMWTTIIAITLLFIESRSLCFIVFKLQPYFFIFGWGLPIVLTGLLLLDKTNVDAKNQNFVYGLYQAIVAVSLLILCFVVTLGCLIFHQRYKRQHLDYRALIREENGVTESEVEAGTSSEDMPNNTTKYGSLPTINESTENSPNVLHTDIEDLFNTGPTTDRTNLCNNACPSGLGCESERNYCQGIIRQYQEPINDDLELIEEECSGHDPQIFRHIVLLILLLVSMFIGLVVCIWTLVMETMTGIYVEMTFLDVTMNLGQSFIVFAVFGTDTKELLWPILRKWRQIWNRDSKLILPMESELSIETLHICDQFTKYHLNKCKVDIVRDRRWRWKVYENVFTGIVLVDWLIEIGVARDRVDAINYARHLVEGRILKHIKSKYHFYDRNLLYTFN